MSGWRQCQGVTAVAGQWQCDGSGSAGMEIEEASVNGDEALEFIEPVLEPVVSLAAAE